MNWLRNMFWHDKISYEIVAANDKLGSHYEVISSST
jgi:hypothetical protein